MNRAAGTEAAVALLRLLPTEMVRRILALMPPNDAARLQSALDQAPKELTPEAERAALQLFFQRRRPTTPTSISPPALAPNSLAEPTESARAEAPATTSSPNSVSANAADAAPSAAREQERTRSGLQQADTALLARALEDEQPGTIALVLSRLEPDAAAAVVQRLSSATRAAVAKRLCQPVAVDHALAEQMILAVLNKMERLASVPPVPTAAEKQKQVAALLRKLGRKERTDLLAAIAESDPAAVEEIRRSMYGYEDLARVPERQLQSLLTQVDVKTLAVALKGSPDSLAERVLRNLPNRSRQALSDEISLLASVPKSAIEEAQNSIADLLRQFEEQGKITFDG